MATETHDETGQDKVIKLKPPKPPKPPKPERAADGAADGGDGKAGKKPKPPKHEAADAKPPKPKKLKPAGKAAPDTVERVRAAAGRVAKAATKPRGVAIGAAAAAVGLVAGFVAVSGTRRASKARDAKGVKAGTSVPKEREAETIGAIMAKAAEHGTGK